MKIKEKEITDNEMLDMLNCPVCLSVVNAIKLKKESVLVPCTMHMT